MTPAPVERWEPWLEEVLGAARRAGADDAMVRVEEARRDELRARGSEIDGITSEQDAGAGLSVWCDGSEGFASTPLLGGDPSSLVAQAMAAARASASTREGTVPASVPAVSNLRGESIGVATEDPFAVPLAERVELLRGVGARASSHAGVSLCRSFLQSYQSDRLVRTSRGGRIRTGIVETGVAFTLHARRDGQTAQRSYPTSLFAYEAGGYEIVRGRDLLSHVDALAEEVSRLVAAPRPPHERTTLVVGPYQLMLQIHESIGHPLELDRVFGDERSFAGASFATPDRLGAEYGSPLLSAVVDPAHAGAMGTYGFDDEGTPSQRRPVIEHGVLVDYLSSRESAARLRKASTASMRCVGWKHKPIVRMSNLSIVPGTSSLEELVRGTERGLMVEHVVSGSIDDMRENFQFSCEIGWEIREGALTGRIFRTPSYAGRTLDFWRSLDGLGDASTFRVGGTPSCGKGEPLQIAHVSHGAPVARFRDVEVGVF